MVTRERHYKRVAGPAGNLALSQGRRDLSSQRGSMRLRRLNPSPGESCSLTLQIHRVAPCLASSGAACAEAFHGAIEGLFPCLEYGSW